MFHYPNDIGFLIVKLLACAGGALIGMVLTGVLGRVFFRFIGMRSPPRPVTLFLRIAGWVGGAFATAWLLFHGTGGWGLGGSGSGESAGENAISKSAAESKKQPPTAGPTIRVTMLGGGRVKNGAFYLIEGNPAPRPLAGVQEAIQRLRDQPTLPVGLEIQVYADSVARQHPAVVDLESWAESIGLRVSVVTLPRELP